MAFTMASMMIGVNVIFSPCFFWNSFFMRLRQRTTFVISASTKLVTCGEVCTEFTIWSAMSFLMRSISIISSPSPIFIAGAEGLGATAGAALTGAVGAGLAAGV